MDGVFRGFDATDRRFGFAPSSSLVSGVLSIQERKCRLSLKCSEYQHEHPFERALYDEPKDPATKDDFYDSGSLDHIQFRCEHASCQDVVCIRARFTQGPLEANMTETLQGRSDAESIAVQVLNFIVTDDDRIVPFLNVTGLLSQHAGPQDHAQHL